MLSEQQPDKTVKQPAFAFFPPASNEEAVYPTRDASNNKLDVTELFTHFTASIIREDVPFTR